ncbi:MAG: luxQ 3 [Panacagrimonas sp.]|jgi:signal transduction histidine kinase|nr:ATP-binding protein [Panacagrimonas sp.]MCC2657544.1 luxQ 3 [Panacagrimonas sp.]
MRLPKTPAPWRPETRWLEQLFEKVPSFMAVLEGPEHVFVMANESYRQTFGGRELIGRSVRDAFPELQGQVFFDLMDQAYTTARRVTLRGSRALVRNPEGEEEERYFDLVFQPIVAEDGRVSGLFLQGVDVTPYKQSERRDLLLVRIDDAARSLSDAEQIASTMMQLLCEDLGAHRAAYFDVDPEGRVGTAMSDYVQGMRTMVGGTYPLEDYGAALAAAMRADRPYIVENVADATLTGPERERYAALEIGATIVFPLHKDGELIAVMAVYQREPRRWRPHEVELVRLVVSRCWEAVSRARAFRALRKADQRKDEFIATLAHELRNPLAPLRTGLDYLSRTTAPIPAGSPLPMMARQVDHLVRLVDDLLDVARITRGKIEIERERVRLAEAVAHAVETSRVEIDSRRHQLTVSAPAGPVTVVGDRVRLTQIFANLIHNAAKYTPHEGRIEISIAVEGDQAVVRVRDNGIGIEPDLQAEIFEIFAQGRRFGPVTGSGLGIGLSLVQKLVALHGGTVRVSSRGRSQGATFEVHLPSAATVAAAVESRAGPTPSTPTGLRVLVVDDNRDAADALSMMLSLAGIDVRVAYDATGALALLEPFDPDVGLLDIGLPDLDGYELAVRIRAARPHRPPMLVALTGWGQSQDRERSARAGFDLHLVKPVTEKDLLAVLSSARR